GPGAPHDERESKHADQGRRDDRDQRQVAEQVASGEVAAHEQERHRETQHGGRHHRGEAQQQRVSERAQIVRVAEERGEVRECEPPVVVTERVVGDAQQRVDQEDQQEEPDEDDAQRGQEAAHARHRRLRHGGGDVGAAHSSRSVSAADAGKVTRTAAPIGSTSWCHGSPTSTLSTTPAPTSTSYRRVLPRYDASTTRPSNVFSLPAPSAMFSGRTATTQRSPGPSRGLGAPRTAPMTVSATRPAAVSRQVPERKLLVPTKSATNRPVGRS